MRKRNFNIALLLLTGLLQTCRYDDYAAVPHMGISFFPDAKPAAMAFTFDDNCASSFSAIAPMFQKYGYNATFFIIAGQIGSDKEWEKWKTLSKKGFEIGNHSFNHPNLAKMSDMVQLRREINDSHALISDKIGKSPFVFAHPNNSTSELVNRIMMEKHYVSRIYPADFASVWGVTSSSPEAYFNDFIASGIKNNYLLVVAAHGVGDGWQTVTPHWLEYGLERVKARENEIAIDNFGNLSKYKIEQENTRMVVDSGIDDKLIVKLESSLDTTVFNFPLTLFIDNPNLKRSQITPLAGSKILGFSNNGDRTLIKLLPKSKIQIQLRKWN